MGKNELEGTAMGAAMSVYVHEVHLEPKPTEAGRARDHVRRQLQRWGLQDIVDTTELLVTELVSNAIIHTEVPMQLRLTYDGALRVEVMDGSSAAPGRRPTPLEDLGGWGLRLVAALSESWGWQPYDGGKTVWCSIATPSHVAA